MLRQQNGFAGVAEPFMLSDIVASDRSDQRTLLTRRLNSLDSSFPQSWGQLDRAANPV